MTRLLLVGATGLVGRAVLNKALSDARIDRVVAPTRRPLAVHPKLVNPVVDFARLSGNEDWAADAVICTLGTTRAKAGSAAAFRAVDYDLTLAVARIAKQRGATCFVLTSSMGANAKSPFLYMRTKGEIEHALTALAFSSLTIVRPGMIGGDRDEFRGSERLASVVLRIAAPILPGYYLSPATAIADALIEAAIAGQPGCHLIKADRLTGA